MTKAKTSKIAPKKSPPLSGGDLRRIASSLEGVTEAPHFDRTAFKVARIFVTLAADGKSANFKFSPDEQEFKCMLAPEAFSPVPGGWGKMGYTTGVLAKLNEAELRDALEMGHRHALPKAKPGKSKTAPAKRGRQKT